MNLRKQHMIGLAVAAIILATGGRVPAQEQKPFSPAIEQLRETVAERLQAVADKLGLTTEQRTKIREAHAAFSDKCEALRTRRRELLQSELEAIRDVLTSEQREMVKGFVEDLREAAREPGTGRDWPEVAPLRDALAERVQAADDKLALTPEQKTKIRDLHAPFAEKYRANRAERRELVEAELKAIAEGLTPEQREKAQRYIEGRMVHAAVVQSVAERLQAAADKLGLTDEQRGKIREIHAGFRDRFRAWRARAAPCSMTSSRRLANSSPPTSATECVTSARIGLWSSASRSIRTTPMPSRSSVRPSPIGCEPSPIGWASPRSRAARSGSPTPPSRRSMRPRGPNGGISAARSSRPWARC